MVENFIAASRQGQVGVAAQFARYRQRIAGSDVNRAVGQHDDIVRSRVGTD